MAHLPPCTASEPDPRDEFERKLREWYAASEPRDTVGPPANYPGRGWVFALEFGRRFRLHADSTREGVGRYLELLELYPGMDWWVGVNERGGKNKVSFGPEREVIPGFYFYEHGVEVVILVLGVGQRASLRLRGSRLRGASRQLRDIHDPQPVRHPFAPDHVRRPEASVAEELRDLCLREWSLVALWRLAEPAGPSPVCHDSPHGEWFSTAGAL